MAADPADTQREIANLRSDMDAALQELQRRLRGGFRAVATPAGAAPPVAVAERARAAVEQARQRPGAVGAGMLVAAAVVGFGAVRAIQGWRQRRTPRERVKRRLEDLRSDVEERLQGARRQTERARRRGLMIRLGGDDDGGVRVTDAEGRPVAKPEEEGATSNVLKNLLWAVMLTLFIASASVVARRLAGGVWRATLREEPPTEKS